ncbi:uncharacterized protein H6S33_011234 [Morchella sextelata]|uniref:uncharacterized protein n=1 Tax=Morchella sextelata TaxID=1174677 RepID=UPI001D036B8C|nr:uncharacterized protein H6S33_009807 [Morchella sextelata]XP_044696002.1 uncharacterized protein H6S33_011234 [Morchella sextelata]KAH0602320.1 hypothetical protein H6S33_009807 [Morchella sextelata]KAH0610807.1 hypothetical protein H6S33_011234 [Morchella sextelata]
MRRRRYGSSPLSQPASNTETEARDVLDIGDGSVAVTRSSLPFLFAEVLELPHRSRQLQHSPVPAAARVPTACSAMPVEKRHQRLGK